MIRSAWVLAAAALAAAPAPAAPPSPDPKSLAVSAEDLSESRELVRKLGSESFAEREAADAELAAMGRLARAALLEGATSDPNPEIRARCNALLPRATALEMKARLDTFLADAEGRFDHDLPGWNRLRATVRGEWELLGWTFAARPGADKAARELFVEFLKAPHGRQLLAAVADERRDLGPMVAGLKYELYNARFGRGGAAPRTPGVMEVAALMFADSLAPFAPAGPRNNLFSSVVTSSGLSQAVQGGDNKAVALRAVLGAWFDTRTDAYEMYSAMNLANSAKNPGAAARLAVRLLGSSAAPITYRGYAVNMLVTLKPKECLPELERLIGDEAVVGTINRAVNGKVERTTVTVGEMALAAAVVTTDQRLEDYHIEDALRGGGGVSYARYRIPEDKRKAAFVKYGWYRLKGGLNGPGGPPGGR